MSRALTRTAMAGSLLLAVTAAAAEEGGSPPVTEVPARSPPPASAAPASPFSTHHSNYVIVGPEDSPATGNVTVKFQLSLKYDTGANWYFAYTQRAYWDIAEDSGPITDMSIEPELFYFWKLAPDSAERWNLPAVRLGFVHESNGEDGADSRAWNRAYVEPRFRWGGAFFEPKLWGILSTEDHNDDIADYYGYVDLVFGYEADSRQRFTVTGRQGSRHGSVQLDYALPMQALLPSSRMRPWFYMQAWFGYGETLLYYDLHTRAFRIGIEFHP